MGDSPSDFIKDQRAAERLGKAFFWDTQVGGDGQVACGVCHFSQGVDSRTINTMADGGDGFQIDNAAGNPFVAGDEIGANAFVIGGNDRVGSQGVRFAAFMSIDPGSAVDNCGPAGALRQRTGRNTPNVAQAEENIHNFWDGRALNVFNGVDGSGDANADAQIFVDGEGVQVRIHPASLASQAVGPPNNNVEMSCDGRTFPELARKLLHPGITPLGQQIVANDDSLLDGISNFPSRGLGTSYEAMVMAAFNNDLWNSTDLIPEADIPVMTVAGGQSFSQIEANFSLFWGLAVQAYVDTLDPANTRFDRVGGEDGLTGQELDGFEIFTGDGRCDSCHRENEVAGDDFTAASRDSGGGGNAFVNTGVRPAAEDGGVQPENVGEFKTSHVRNIALTGPYFHNGSRLTLLQVLDFYDDPDAEGFISEETDSQIRQLDLSEGDKLAVVAFLLTLTDDSARISAAPFDRPSITVPNFNGGGELAATGRDGDSRGPGTQFQSREAPAEPFLLNDVNDHFTR